MSEEMEMQKKIHDDAVMGFEYMIGEQEDYITYLEHQRDILLNKIPRYKRILEQQQVALEQIKELNRITEEMDSHILESDYYGGISSVEGSSEGPDFII